MKNKKVKRNDPFSRRGRRTNDTIVSAVIFIIQPEGTNSKKSLKLSMVIGE